MGGVIDSEAAASLRDADWPLDLHREAMEEGLAVSRQPGDVFLSVPVRVPELTYKTKRKTRYSGSQRIGMTAR